MQEQTVIDLSQSHFLSGVLSTIHCQTSPESNTCLTPSPGHFSNNQIGNIDSRNDTKVRIQMKIFPADVRNMSDECSLNSSREIWPDERQEWHQIK
jgi:hypothetical protein